MKKVFFVGLVVFVMFLFVVIGSVGGVIFLWLFGMSCFVLIVGIVIGSLFGNGMMYLFVDLFVKYVVFDNLVIKYGGIVVIVVIVVLFECCYCFVKKCFIVEFE